jgi:hypothetical protein
MVNVFWHVTQTALLRSKMAQELISPGKVPISIVLYIDWTSIKWGIPVLPVYCKLYSMIYTMVYILVYSLIYILLYMMLYTMVYTMIYIKLYTMLYTMIYVANTISVFSVYSCRTQQHPCSSPYAKQRWGTFEDTDNSSMGM